MLLLFQSATEMWLGSKKENEQVCTCIYCSSCSSNYNNFIIIIIIVIVIVIIIIL